MLMPSLTRSSHSAPAAASNMNPVDRLHLASPTCGMTTLPDCPRPPAQCALTVFTAAVIPVLIGPCGFEYSSTMRYQPAAPGTNFACSCWDGEPQSGCCTTPSATRVR